ncbi:hypothetical protein Q9966_006589 [Columba livia]|nr:hypothetical protein Q9966_006589 [Columba livia]
MLTSDDSSANYPISPTHQGGLYPWSHLKIISCSIPSEFTKLIGYPDEKNTYTLHMQPGIEASVLMLLEQKNQKKFESNPQDNVFQTKAPQPGVPGKGYFLSSLTAGEAHLILVEKKIPKNRPSNPALGQLQQPHIPASVLLSRDQSIARLTRGERALTTTNPLQITQSVTPVQLNTCRMALAVLSDSDTTVYCVSSSGTMVKRSSMGPEISFPVLIERRIPGVSPSVTSAELNSSNTGCQKHAATPILSKTKKNPLKTDEREKAEMTQAKNKGEACSSTAMEVCRGAARGNHNAMMSGPKLTCSRTIQEKITQQKAIDAFKSCLMHLHAEDIHEKRKPLIYTLSIDHRLNYIPVPLNKEYGPNHKMLTTFQQSPDAFHVHEAHLDGDRNPSK